MASAVIFISNHSECKSLSDATNFTGSDSLTHCDLYTRPSVEPFNCLGNNNQTEYYSESIFLIIRFPWLKIEYTILEKKNNCNSIYVGHNTLTFSGNTDNGYGHRHIKHAAFAKHSPLV